MIDIELFDRKPDYSAATFPPPREFQQRAHVSLRQGVRDGHRRQLLVAPTGSGKCLGKDTPVLMADGTIKAVQDIRAGEQLLGPDGMPRNVLSVTSGREQLYRIIPRKGMSYVVNASHILSLRKTPGSDGLLLSDGTHIARDADIVNINVEVFAASNKTVRHCLKGWRADAIEFPVKHNGLLLDPYILGCWLGDGSQHQFALTSPACKMVEEWKATAANFGYEVVERRGATGCPTWLIASRDRGPNGAPFNVYIGTLDIYGLRDRKHVPHEYKVAPIKDRLQLIAGMIDSDGHQSNGGYDWISKYRELAEDFASVCRSVGLAAYVSPCVKGIRSIGFTGAYWRVSVSGDCSIIPSRDKPAMARRQKKRHLVHGIRVEPIGEGDYYGFEIDGDHLFLLGDFTVTHNTYLGLQVIYESLKKGKRAVFVCDRTALIEQTSARAEEYGLRDHGIVQANHWRRDNSLPFQIASIQTIQARGYWPDADVIVIDEAHTQYKATREKLASTGAAVVGLTATPCSKGLGLSYTNMVNAATMHELTKSGVLVPMNIQTCVTPDMKGAATSSGEWTDKAASEREMQIIGDVVAEWSTHGEGRKTIAFGPDIAYCEELVRRFNEAGINAATFTSETPDSERQMLLEEFRKPDSAIRMLVSVEALAKGFDVQDIGCVIDARPLRKSLSTAIQMWGRGLRSSPDTGKIDCKLLDHSGNIRRFLADYTDVFFNGFSRLDTAEKLDKVIRKDEDYVPAGCPACGYKPFHRRCLSCGHEKQSQALVTEQAGEMVEIRLGKKVLAADKHDLWRQLCAVAARANKPQGRAAHLYKDITGEWPPRDWLYDFTEPAPPTPATLNKIKQLNIAWRKGGGSSATT